MNVLLYSTLYNIFEKQIINAAKCVDENVYDYIDEY